MNTNYGQATLSKDLIERVNREAVDSFGIGRTEKEGQLFLISEGRKLPIVELRMKIDNGRGDLICATREDIDFMLAIFHQRLEKKIHLAAFIPNGEGGLNELLSTRHDSLTGFLFVVAAEEYQKSTITHALSIFFDKGRGTMFRHSMPELVNYMDIASGLIERYFNGH